MASRASRLGKIISLVALALLSALLILQEPEARERHSALEERAQRIFALQESRQLKADERHLAALSVALAFHDDEGLEKLLTPLEERARVR